MGFLSSAVLFRGMLAGLVLVIAFTIWVVFWAPRSPELTVENVQTPVTAPAATDTPAKVVVAPTATVRPATVLPTAAAAQPAISPTPAVPQSYTVKAGDTISGIAEKVGVTTADLLKANNLSGTSLLQIGQVLQVPSATSATATPAQPSNVTPTPVSYTTYTVRTGETISGIAATFGTTVQGIVALNGLSSPDKLQIGQTLKIPSR